MRCFVVLALVAFLGVCQAQDMQQCFYCVDCGNDAGTPRQCNRDQEVCMKIVMGQHIIRRCGERELCGLGKLERASNKIWTSVTNVFKDVDEDSKLVYCCDHKLCNSAIQSLPNILLLLLPLLFVRLFKY